MRVISGKYKGRKLNGFDIDGTRPTMDRIKESMFALIQDKINNSIVLDLFAGTGALGIEAVSNGSKRAYLVDINQIAIKTIKENAKDIENVEIIKSDYKEFLKNCKIKFDLIFLDPPYKFDITEVINLIDKYDLLNENGLIICETDYSFEINREIYKIKKYGPKYIQIYY